MVILVLRACIWCQRAEIVPRFLVARGTFFWLDMSCFFWILLILRYPLLEYWRLTAVFPCLYVVPSSIREIGVRAPFPTPSVIVAVQAPGSSAAEYFR